MTPRVEAVVLAAGLSTRMPGRNKLTALIDGRPMIARVVETLRDSRLALAPRVVTGYEAERVAEALDGLPVQLVPNPDYRDGMGSSIAVGVASLPDDCDAVLVCLGDMPWVRVREVDALLGAAASTVIAVPRHAGRRGHPVLFGSAYFAELKELSGDRGARDLLERHESVVVSIPCDHDGVLRDVDRTQELGA